MTRSLPENTVDAWTAIALANQAAAWIWLPTTRAGRTDGGSHPGDLSSLVGRRLAVIENKGIEERTAIPLGAKGAKQCEMLVRVEEAGHARLSDQDRPPLGWVFYGLPLPDGAPIGRDWVDFAHWHHLACPHQVHSWGHRTSISLRKVRNRVLPPLPYRGGCSQVSSAPDAAFVPFTLADFGRAMRCGQAGLPLGRSESDVLWSLNDLATAARSARQSVEDMRSDEFLALDVENPAALLADLGSTLSQLCPHLTLMVA